MANVFFALKITWPTITNDIRISVYDILDINTPITFLQKAAPHLDQQYDFPGLPRLNFIYKVQEYSIGGSTFISELGNATFVPANDELDYKSPQDIQIGVTEIEGAEPDVWPEHSTLINIPGWIGYEIIFGRNGVQYPMRKNVDYTWDSITGDLAFLGDGDETQPTEWFHVEFEIIIRQSSGGVGSSTGAGFPEILVVTANYTMVNADIGKKILIDPAGTYLEITLPDYTSVQANKLTYFEMVYTGSDKCAKIKSFSGQQISFLETMADLYICPNESFELYKRVVVGTTYQWRVQNAEGNFKSVGEMFYSDMPTVLNAVRADGSNKDYQTYSRLYNRYVLLGSLGISYASWSSANILTRMRFSLKDIGSNNFRIPDMQTTPVYMRPAGVSVAGEYGAGQLLQHQHLSSANTSVDGSNSPYGSSDVAHSYIGKYTGSSTYRPDATSRSVEFSVATGHYETIDGTENMPNSRSSNLFIRI